MTRSTVVAGRFAAWSLFAALAALLFASCGGSRDGAPTSAARGTGTVSFSAVWQAPPQGASTVIDFPDGLRSAAAGGLRPMAIDVCDDYGIDWVNLEVWAGTNKVADGRFECWRHEGTLPNVPAGDNLTLQAWATISPYTVAFWRLEGGAGFRLSAGEAKRFDNVVMSYIGPDGSAPTVVSIAPDNNSQGLPATTAVRFAFSEPMAPGSVIAPGAVLLTDRDGVSVPGTTIYDNASFSALFRPSARLAAGVRHTVTLSTSLTDRAGRGLASPYVSSFTVDEPGGWDSPPLLLETDNAGPAQNPQVAMDASGNAVAVWQQSDNFRTNIWANRYTPSGGWGTATLIETDNAGSAQSPQAAVDGSGNAVAVWSQSDGTRYTIRANRYTLSGGWGAATVIQSDNAGGAHSPQVALDASGNAVAVWQQSDGTRYNIRANRYTPSGGWGTATVIESDDAGDAQGPQVAMDGSGNAIAVWYQSDGTRTNIWANRYTPSGGWGTAAVIETDNAGDAQSPQVAMDGSGNAVALWHQYAGSRFHVWANRYTPSGGWGTAALVETDNTGSALSPQVAMRADGSAVAVWYQYAGTRTDIWANRFTPSGGWGTATLIETDSAGSALYPQVAMDGSGNAVAVWQQSEGVRSDVWANRYTPAGGWGTPTLVDTDYERHAQYPQVASDPAGNAVAVWHQSDGVRWNVWARHFKPPGWGTAALIETDNSGPAMSPQIATDGSGNAVAVWSQSDGTRYSIWSNRYTPSGGWGTATLIETNDAGNALSPKIAMDVGGNAVAVWYQSDGTRNNIYSNRYTPSGGWGTATLIETDNAGHAGDPDLAMDRDGNAIAVWHQLGGPISIRANRYTPSGGWGTAAVIIGNAMATVSPQIAMDVGGNAVCVWQQWDGDRYHIWANRYTRSGGWGTAAPVETESTLDSNSPRIAIDGSGNAIAVWAQSDGTRFNMWANRYTLSGGWGTATLIESDDAGDILYPAVAMDVAGNAVAVWQQFEGTVPWIRANRYTPSGGWGTATLVGPGSAAFVQYPKVATDGSGGAVAVWSQSDGTRDNIWANRYTPSGGWGTATLIETNNAGLATYPAVAMDGSGNAFAVWPQHDGTRFNIWTNRSY